MQHTLPCSSHAPRTAAFSTQIRRAHRRAGRESLQTSCAVKKKSGKNVVCSKTLTIKSGHKDKVVKMCHKVVDFSKERMKDKKNGVLAFECSQDRWEDNVLHFWERYDGNRNMGLHNTSDELSTFMSVVQQHLESPVGMALYEWQDGQIGMAGVHGGPKGEGGLDDATGAGGAGGASMKFNPAAAKAAAAKAAAAQLQGEEEDAGREKKWGLGLNFKFPWQKKDDAAKKKGKK